MADPLPARRVLAARNAVAVVFTLNGVAVASWFSRVPAIRSALGLSAGELGLLLLAVSIGALLALPTAGLVVRRLGTARTALVAHTLVAAGLVSGGLTIEVVGSVAGAAAALFAAGLGAGTSEVAMNVEAATVERRLGRTVMPRFHAAWSIGSVTGAGLGAGAAALGFALAAHLGLIAVLVLAGTLVAVRSFVPTAVDPLAASRRTGRIRDAWREPRTLLIGVFVLVMALAEGTANDWLALAFVDGYGVTDAAGAAVFGVFVAAMTLGRLAGTAALDRWGRVPVLLTMIGGACVGALTTVLATSGPLAVAGVALWGLGVSLGFPVGMSAAADEEEQAAARVSVVAAIGYTAFLAGPPLIGFLGDRIGILRALLVVPALLVPALALVPATRPPARPPHPAAGALPDPRG